MALAAVTLDDKYTLERGRIYLNGVQALARLPMMQRQRDLAAGLETGCFISGYRGSPLGGLDQTLWSAREHLKRDHVFFQPGINEDLAATAVWGSQQVNMFEGAKYDGVFAMWYGKGPGVDRSGDVFKHGNAAGTAPHGGVLLLAGDDHACKSSTLPHQSEYAFIDAQIPVLNPSGVQEILDYGLYGWAMSRFSGAWIGMKTIGETVDSSASVHVAPERVRIVLPDDFDMPHGGLNIRWPDLPMDQEYRLARFKIPAALAFARANRLDHTVIDSPKRRFGIVTTGKSYLDVRQALEDLGIDDTQAAEIGITVYKVGMSWPLEPVGIRRFAEGLEEILVVEEKRGVIEGQLKEQLYNMPDGVRPRVLGKFDEAQDWILPSIAELSPAMIAKVIAKRIARFHPSERIQDRLKFLVAKEDQHDRLVPGLARTPFFCSGCPHNSSTRVPEGSRAVAGIGCHYMAIWMPERTTSTFTQMGGEGTPWIGQAPFTETQHIFANLGDGTYNHSGILAIRAAVAAKVNITYKILFNDAVAMTGGQTHDGGDLTVPMIARQVVAEGAKHLVVVTDDLGRYETNVGLPAHTNVYHREKLDEVQRELREMPGVTVLIYDQTCAAEKRRRRKRGKMVDPQKRVFINDAVCEGCGDCSKTSNCLSVVPVETELGTKREIDQSSCNKDFSCVNGFCPSFVTVLGGGLRKNKASAVDADGFGPLPVPALPSLDDPYGILVTGVGGTGVVTVGALLGMAAHLEGRGVSVLDMTGLAQKGGAVYSHIRIARTPEDIAAVRIAAGGADLLLGCDFLVAASIDSLSKVQKGTTRAFVSRAETIVGSFTQNPDLKFPTDQTRQALIDGVGADAVEFLDAARLAVALLGDSIAANLFVLGYAWQKGTIPVSAEAIDKAIELNAVAVEFNKKSFLWGRRAAVDLAAVEAVATPKRAATGSRRLSESLDEIIDRRARELVAYQNAAYAERYLSLVGRMRQAEIERTPGRSGLVEAVARNLHKLMAYKDEYEVARLYSDGEFLQKLSDRFDGDYKLQFHLAPPMLADRDPTTGHLKKRVYGPWMLKAFGLLAHFKGLRGTAWDLFGRTEERRTERRLIGEYVAVLEEILSRLSQDNYETAVELARIPHRIRGFGHVKETNLAEAKKTEAALLAAFRSPAAISVAAE
ncbi:MAG TPA: indolepyruvate ferredoxin oxidoreductase family protein [Aliidongia sp.]|uniref:indolepyruvate ferredoxin oxidoreductase family protein n=1 Tax=Aliidongia sp. TaxID=1914230 RepID=UPI002DDD7A5B|nr:indolepyruvate ferredoxin oxidoreductase family protein [Aliidongia sp.]HEV2677741.1 indolepyruvate ferredoxin oxidoreductase family protein [Aliidongia sp.]